MPALATIEDPRRPPAAVAALILATILAGLGCTRRDRPGATPTPTPSSPEPAVFPLQIRADDPAVNDFVQTVIQTCVKEDYDAFRLLWSAREEPITAQEFERGWRAIRHVLIQDLRKMKTQEGDTVYGVLAHLEFDPSEVPKPSRDVVLMLVRENDCWRAARAPDPVRKLMKGDAEPPAGPPTPPPVTDQQSGAASPPASSPSRGRAPSPSTPPPDRR